MEVAVAAVVTAAVVGGASSYRESRQAAKAQKTAIRNQEAYTRKQEQEAMRVRREQIDQQREQLNLGAYSTRTTGETGIVGTLEAPKQESIKKSGIITGTLG